MTPTEQPDGSVTIVVNVHTARYEAEVKRAVKLLHQGGFEAIPMTPEHILRAAAEITEDLRAHAEAERQINHLNSKQIKD